MQDEGAYPDTTGMGLGVLTSWMSGGCYAIPVIQTWLTNVITNTTPVSAYRGAGRPEGAFLIERAIDLVADETGLDPAEVRRRNFIQPDQFPYNTAAAPDAVFYDSGNYPAALDQLLLRMGYDALLDRQQSRNADPSQPLMGIGLSCWIEIASFGPNGSLEGFGHLASWESANLRVQPDGSVLVSSGAAPHGQGTGTSLAQIAADELGMDFDTIDVRFGDTETVQQGIGTMGSRIMAVGGDAVRRAAATVKERAVQIAAHLLEASPRGHRGGRRDLLGPGHAQPVHHLGRRGLRLLPAPGRAGGLRGRPPGRDGVQRGAQLQLPVRRLRVRGGHRP